MRGDRSHAIVQVPPVELPPPPGQVGAATTAPARRRRWVVVFVVAAAAAAVGTWMVITGATGHELLATDFGESAEPFEIGATDWATYDLSNGNYRISVTSTLPTLNTSVGEFTRVAFAVGVRAEVVEVTDSESSVGAMCVGEGAGGGGLVGYGAFVRPGGEYSVERQDADGSLETLAHGTNERIGGIRRVSIMCVPTGATVTILAFANGVQLATVDDDGGYDSYAYAGLSVRAPRGAVVRFTSASARVPDDAWAA